MKTRPTHPDGSPMVNSREMAILLGVTEAEIRQHAARVGTGTVTLPAEWIARGQQRQRIYREATGRADMVGAIEYWAGQQ